jgi:hypothetical protein
VSYQAERPLSYIFAISCASMPPKKRKISDLTAGDADTLLVALNEFQGILDEDDDELPRGLITVLDDLRSKLEVVKVGMSLSFLID